MARVNEGHIEVRIASNTQLSFLELGRFAWLPMISEAIAIHEQAKQKNADRTNMEERPDVKIKFNN